MLLSFVMWVTASASRYAEHTVRVLISIFALTINAQSYDHIAFI